MRGNLKYASNEWFAIEVHDEESSEAELIESETRVGRKYRILIAPSLIAIFKNLGEENHKQIYQEEFK